MYPLQNMTHTHFAKIANERLFRAIYNICKFFYRVEFKFKKVVRIHCGSSLFRFARFTLLPLHFSLFVCFYYIVTRFARQISCRFHCSLFVLIQNYYFDEQSNHHSLVSHISPSLLLYDSKRIQYTARINAAFRKNYVYSNPFNGRTLSSPPSTSLVQSAIEVLCLFLLYLLWKVLFATQTNRAIVYIFFQVFFSCSDGCLGNSGYCFRTKCLCIFFASVIPIQIVMCLDLTVIKLRATRDRQ